MKVDLVRLAVVAALVLASLIIFLAHKWPWLAKLLDPEGRSSLGRDNSHLMSALLKKSDGETEWVHDYATSIHEMHRKVRIKYIKGGKNSVRTDTIGSQIVSIVHGFKTDEVPLWQNIC